MPEPIEFPSYEELYRETREAYDDLCEKLDRFKAFAYLQDEYGSAPDHLLTSDDWEDIRIWGELNDAHGEELEEDE